MSKMKKILMMSAAYVLVAALAIGGTLAYLQSEDSDVNVMTLGNVDIEQLEYERVVNEDGTYPKITTDRGTGYKLKEFTQAKPLYPEVGVIKWDDTYVWLDQLENGAGGMQVFGCENAVDKFVVVENTGKSDAYVRTLIAFEIGDATVEEWDELIGYSNHFTWDKPEEIGVITVDDSKYMVVEFVYKGAGETRHKDGVLPVGDKTYNSLGQIYMSSEATNEDVEKLDGNKNGTYDVLVLSQAVQTEGFKNAITALDTSFGDTTIKLATEWFTGVEATKPVIVTSAQELKDAMLIKGANIVLSEDIVVDASTPLQWGSYMFVANGREVTIDLNGHDIIVDESASTKINYMFTTANGGTLNIVGDGVLESKNKATGICWAMNKNDQINIYGGQFKSNGENWSAAQALLYTNSGNIDVYGGKFYREGHWCSNVADDQGNRVCIVFHEGAMFIKEDIQQGDSARIKLADGCSMKEVSVDGNVWYKVVAE